LNTENTEKEDYLIDPVFSSVFSLLFLLVLRVTLLLFSA